MFKEERSDLQFSWEDLGDIQEGRPNLGNSTSVTMYRLMQYSLRDVLIRRFGPDLAGEILYESGKSAGKEFCKNLLDTSDEGDAFIAELQHVLKEHGVGIFRVEEALENQNMTITIAEDLDCSGLPMSDETVCDYDEGFLAGVLESYTGNPFHVREVDCWATGDRVCRFQARLVNQG